LTLLVYASRIARLSDRPGCQAGLSFIFRSLYLGNF